MFTRTSIVINMRKRFFVFFIIFFCFTLNDLKQKMKVKVTKVLLRHQGLATR